MIPQSTIYGLQNYAKDHIPTGSFLRACLSNDLMGAFGKADLFNKEVLEAITIYIYNEMPANCHGSPKHYKEWIENETL